MPGTDIIRVRASGVSDEDGLSWGPGREPEKARVQKYIDTVVGPTAEALYGVGGF